MKHRRRGGHENRSHELEDGQNRAARLSREDHLLLREANWVWSEMEDFVRLIQRYRGLYVTAVFASIGWLLSRAVDAAPIAGATDPIATLNRIRARPDIAAVLCIVPLLNTFFVVLMLEAQFHMQSLARYRFLLGLKLGKGIPMWRWERWKESAEGSIRAWTNPSNVVFGFVAITVPIGALWFAWPAVHSSQSQMLKTFWIASTAMFGGMIALVSVLGLMNVRRNRNALPLSAETWERLAFKAESRRGKKDD